METTAAPAGVAAPTERASIGKQLAINIFWFANNFHWLAIISIILPLVVAAQLPERDKGLNLALITAPGIIVAFFVNPLTGALSDYARFKLGRRRPFMIVRKDEPHAYVECHPEDRPCCARHTAPRQRSLSSARRGPTYVFQCSYCGKRFEHKTNDPTLRAHKDKSGWNCSGRRGYWVDTRY
jgi:hypothetical protein